MMKHSLGLAARSRVALAAVAIGGLCSLHASEAEARPRPRAKKFSANKTFGLGIMLGTPTGLSGKYYLGADTAVDFGIGTFPGGRNRDGLHIHFDVLWHPAVLGTTDPFVVPIYFGVGGRVFDFDGNDNDNDNDDFGVGVRVPLGIMLDFNEVPIDIFFELAVTLDIIPERGGLFADFNAAIGIRYYFN